MTSYFPMYHCTGCHQEFDPYDGSPCWVYSDDAPEIVEPFGMCATCNTDGWGYWGEAVYDSTCGLDVPCNLNGDPADSISWVGAS